ncbi:MAG: tRNA preQ1(34) S-adenosylmethionine ribosyltransferase-isomerase QueA [Phycisphaerales bacterium]|nr:tRNA preQ1(34) S-adenosylmethionine ribosyltransferase-isomerase QueA [Phycisphaerales bacterium]
MKVPENMHIDDLDYDLPDSLIATRPVEPRDSARLMVVHCGSGTIEHRHVSDLPTYLRSDDTIVRNRSRVLPARFRGHRVESGGVVSGLFLKEHSEGCWLVMLKSNGRLREGVVIQLEHSGPTLELIERRESHWIVRPHSDESAQQILSSCGLTPLPPYILRARGDDDIPDEYDRERYQTIYAREPGSVAAPTAGLHFTDSLEKTLRAEGVSFLDVILHVGPGTFAPVMTDTLDDHPMHEEWCSIDGGTLSRLTSPDRTGRIVSIGTTTARVLESLPEHHADGDWSGLTDLLISPPFNWRFVDVLLTNFHLPRSTLLALVAARTGIELMHRAYREAVDREYRFYSYGDAMLVI